MVKILTALRIAAFLYLMIVLVMDSAQALTNSHVSRHSKSTNNQHSSKKKRNSAHGVTARSHGRHSHVLASRSQSGSSRRKHRHVVAKTRYAYPMSLFLYQPPA